MIRVVFHSFAVIIRTRRKRTTVTNVAGLIYQMGGWQWFRQSIVHLRISSELMARACWMRSRRRVRESTWDSLSCPWLRVEYWKEGVETCCNCTIQIFKYCKYSINIFWNNPAMTVFDYLFIYLKLSKLTSLGFAWGDIWFKTGCNNNNNNTSFDSIFDYQIWKD